jgi:hypothetical protein
MKAKRFNAMEQSLRRLGMRRRLQRALWYLPAVLSLSVMLPGYALAGKRPTAEVVQQALADPGNLLLLDVVVQRVTVASSMTAYQIDDSVYVPLGELARVLTFLVQVDAAAGRARGFVLKEDRSFALDVSAGTVTIGGTTTRFEPSQVTVQADDIYVDAELLEKWWPVKLKVDLSVLQLKVVPQEPLPLQLRLAREQMARNMGRSVAPTRDLPVQPLPYLPYSFPTIDQTWSLYGGRTGDIKSWAAASTTFLTGDLLGMEASGYAYLGSTAGATQESKFRLTLGRSDPSGVLFGRLPATTASAGNVLIPGMDHVSRSSAAGNGIFVSNVPLSRPVNFGLTSFQGDLQPGWDVELYFNDALVGYQQARPDGTYSFPDQALVFGENRYRLVFHGPQGQIRVETKTLRLDASTVRPDEWLYSVGAQRDDQGFDRRQVQFEYGLNSQSALRAGLATIELGPGRSGHSYISAGLRAFLNGWLVSSDGVWCGECRSGLVSLAVNQRLAYGSVQLSQAFLRDFKSDLYSDPNKPIDASTRARLDLTLPLAPKRALPLTFQLRADRLRQGTYDYSASARVTQSILGTLVTQELSAQNTDGAPSLLTNLQLSRSIAGTSTRAQLSHVLQPTARPKLGVLASDASLPGGVRLNASVTRIFDTQDTTWALNLNRSFGQFALRTGFTRNSTGAVSGSVQVFTSVARDERAKKWRFGVLPQGSYGAASVRTFLDKNLNGVLDSGDEPIAGATFRVNGSTSTVKTDEAGFAYIERINAHRLTGIELNPASLEDSQWSSASRGTAFTARPGRTVNIDFPVVVTADVDGYVYLERNGQQRGVSDVMLHLYDAKGALLTSVRSTGDGYYIFTGVRPGKYSIGVSPELIQRLRLEPVEKESVDITADGGPVNGIDFVLRTAEPEAAGGKAAPAPRKSP